MTRIILFLSSVFLMEADVFAIAKIASTEIQYVGSISINPSQDAKVLADWYERFGIQTQKWNDGGYYGLFQTVAGPFYFGIHPRIPKAPVKSSGSVAVTFHVNDYDTYLTNAAKYNLFPHKIESDATGRFAHFIDPDGNEMTIWGEVKHESN